MALESTRGPLHSPKISWTLVYKRLKTGPEFVPTMGILFCTQSIAHALSGESTSAVLRLCLRKAHIDTIQIFCGPHVKQ